MELKTYYTSTKLAGLPGMPKSAKDVIEWGKKGIIVSRPIKKKDGSDSKFLEYSIDSLPDATRKALAARNTKVGYEPAPVLNQAKKRATVLKQSVEEKKLQRQDARAFSQANFNRLSDRQKTAVNAKLAVITSSNSYIVDHGLAKTEGQQDFCYQYEMGRIDVAPWVRAEIPKVHPATLREWIRKETEQGRMGLVDMYGNRKDQSKIETWQRVVLPDGTVKAPMADTIATLIMGNPHIREKACNESLQALIPQAPAVSDKSMRRYMDKWKAQNEHLYAQACNPDSYKNNYQPAFGSRSEGITGPNQRWEIDATPADLLLPVGRHKIIGLCDVGFRRLKLYVTKTERSRDNAFALRRGLLDWGVPVHGMLVMDQGAPYKTEQFKGLLHDLDIEPHYCNAYSGDEKPHIERAFQTFSHDLVELLPGYCGHNVSERQAIEARKSFAQRLKDPDDVIEIGMTAEELQAFCDRWCATYHDAEHSALGMSPNQALAQWPHPISTIADERALDILLYEPVRRGGRLPIIGKKGIRVDGGFYIHELLEAHIGRPCRAYQEPISFGRIIVYVQNQFGVWEFLCIAEDPDRTDISRKEVAMAARELHATRKREMQRAVNAARKEIKGLDVVGAILANREKKHAEARGNVVTLPPRTIEHESAGLLAAAQAAAALDQRPEEQPQFADDAIEAAGRRWIELNEAREKENKIVPLPTAARPMFATDLEKYKWLKAVDPSLWQFDDARWTGWYEETSEYQLMFGEIEEEQTK